MSEPMDEEGERTEEDQDQDRSDADSPVATARTSTPHDGGRAAGWADELEQEIDSAEQSEEHLLSMSISKEDREGMVVEDEHEEGRQRPTTTASARGGRDESSGSNAAQHIVEPLTAVARIRLLRDRFFQVIRLTGNGNSDISSRGTLTVAGDERYRWTYLWSDTDRQMNISCSFDPKTMRCKGCVTDHHLADENGRSVVILTDQLFVPAAPTSSGGRCLGIIRIEDGTFTELSTFFKEHVMRNMQAGSIVLVASGNQLARCGISAYCADLAAVASDLTRFMPNGCKVSHCPFIFASGTDDKPWLDSIRDLVNWLERGSMVDKDGTLYLTSSHKKMMQIIETNEVGERASLSTASRVVMPSTLGNRTTMVFEVGGGLMPDKITGFTYQQQCDIVQTIIGELWDKTAVRPLAAIRYQYVPPLPDLASAADPEGGNTAAQDNSAHMIVIGTGHAARTRVWAANNGMNTTYHVAEDSQQQDGGGD